MKLAALLLALVVGFAGTLQAHEIGTTRVSATLRDGRYAIEVETDAEPLAEKLAVLGATPDTRDALLLQRIGVSFDGIKVTPEIHYSAEPPGARIRLSGDIPGDARTFTWSYGWTFASYALSVASADGAAADTEWLEGGEESRAFAIAAPASGEGRAATAWRYLVLGFTHIVPHGLDHMLFVIGLFLLSGRLRTVLWQVSAFTVAHSLTLALSIYGLIAVPPSIVEPLIALSIAYVAIENIFLSDLKPWRVSLVFAFGLLHGMGFAGVLTELGLPRADFVTALVAFNVGVEAGQLAVIAAAFALVGWRSHSAWYRGRVVVPASIAIACTAVYWTAERLALL